MPVRMGKPRDAHVTGTASSPMGTYSSEVLVQPLKCTYVRLALREIHLMRLGRTNISGLYPPAVPKPSKLRIWPDSVWESCS